MEHFWIYAGVAAGVMAVGWLYWRLVLSMYPEYLHTTEIHTLTTPDLWKLRICRYRKDRTGGEPVLLVHGLNANQHNFTIPEGASLVDYLVDRGFDCWTVDLRGSRSSQPPFEHHRHEATIDDFLRYDLPQTLHYIREATRYEKIHWVGHSLGGMLLYAYAQKYGTAHIASGVTLGSPIGFKGVDMQWLEDGVFFFKRFPRLLGNMFRAYIPFRGKLRVSIVLFPTNLRNLAPGLTSGEVFNLIDEPLPRVLEQMAGWASKEEWVMLDGELDAAAGLNTLQFPLMAFYGPLDPFVPLEHAEVFFENLPHADKEMIVLSKENGCKQDYSHCELVFGKGAKLEVFKPIARWIGDHASVDPLAETAKEIADRQGIVGRLDQGTRARMLAGGLFEDKDGEDEEEQGGE